MALKVIESDIEEALTDFIRDEFNDNKYETVFSLGYWHASEPRGSNMGTEYIKVEGTPFDYEKKRVVPMAIEQYDGNITALEGIFNAEYAIPMTFQIDIEDQDHFDAVTKAINEVKNRLRAQLRNIVIPTEDGETEDFNMVVTTDNLTPAGDLEDYQGRNYAFGQITFYFDISKNILYGNHVKTYLVDYNPDDPEAKTTPEYPEDEAGEVGERVRLFPLNPQMKRSQSPEAFQNFGTTQVQNIVRQSQYVNSFTLFMEDEPLFWSILENVMNMKEMHKEFKFIMEFYNSANEKEFEFNEPVVILDTEASFTIGEPIFLTLELAKASVKKN